jgi:hypothetical protein
MCLGQRLIAIVLRTVIASLVLASVFAIAETPPAIPPDFELARYEALMRKSPFAPATPSAPAAPNFTQDLYVTGIGRIGEKDVVMISKRGDPQANFSLSTGDPTEEGVELVSVQWSDKIGESKVHLKKGNEFGVVEFDPAAIQAPPQITQPQGQQGVQPQVSIPQVPAVPGAPQVHAPPQQGQQQQQPRPRRRIIRSGP